VSISLLVEIVGDASKLSSELDGAKGKTEDFGGSMLGTAAKVAVVGAAAVGVAVAIGSMTMAAAEDRAEQEALARTYENTGAAVGDYTTKIDEAIAAGAAKAFSDSEVRAGLESLVTATGSAEGANVALAQAMDIARQAGVPLEQASDAVSKALAGNDAALRKLFPGMEKQATAADTLTAATKLSAGAADDYAESSEGMAAKGGQAFDELGETIGAVFLPIMDELMPAIAPVLEAFGELLGAILPVLIPLVKLLAEALKIVATVLTTVVGWLTDLVKWLSDAIAAVGRFLDSINPLKGFELPSLPFMASGGSEPSASTRSGGSGGGGGGNVTIYVSGDPATIERAVVNALRTHARRTGRAIAGIS